MRPSSVGLAFARILSAFDGAKSVRAGTLVGTGATDASPEPHAICDLRVHVRELTHHTLPYSFGLHLAKFEDEGRDYVVLLRLGLGVEKLPRLRGKWSAKDSGANAKFLAGNWLRIAGKPTRWILPGRSHALESWVK